jgi:hypothetical protein
MVKRQLLQVPELTIVRVAEDARNSTMVLMFWGLTSEVATKCAMCECHNGNSH